MQARTGDADALRSVPVPFPAVSVVMPSFNRLMYLREAVDSVLAQTFSEWELVIGDDGSDEETQEYLLGLGKDPRVRVLRLRHTGNPSAVRNAALHRARGQYIAFLDSDDLWVPTKLAVQLEALRNMKGRRWSYSAIRCVGPDGQTRPEDTSRRWVPYEGSIFEELLGLEASVAMPSVVAERTLVEEAGAFDEAQLYFEDYDLWLRMNLLSEVGVIREPLALVRNHDAHYTADRIGVYQARSRLLDKVSAITTTAGVVCVLSAERAKNAIALATAYTSRGQRLKALRTLWRSRQSMWRSPALPRWRLAAVIARALTPLWLYRFLRQCHQRRRAAIALGRA